MCESIDKRRNNMKNQDDSGYKKSVNIGGHVREMNERDFIEIFFISHKNYISCGINYTV